MKKTLIIVLILSIVCIGYIVINNKKALDTQSNVSIQKPENKSFDGEYCFSYLKQEKDIYDNRKIKLNVNGTTVSAEKTGSSRSSEYSVGYTGAIKGTIDTQGVINGINSVVIADGGKLTQEERYQLSGNQLIELTYKYKEDFSNNILRIDETATDNGQGEIFPIKTLYSRIPCK